MVSFRTLIAITIVLLSSAFMSSALAANASSDALVVGVKVAPPFVVDDGDGNYSGLAIDLWQQTAAEHHWQYSYKQYDLSGLLQAVKADQVDVGLGAITATAERSRNMDFAHPMTSSGLGVVVRDEGGSGWLAVVQAIMSPAFLGVVSTLSLLLLIVGFLVWLAEHKRNPEEFGGSRPQGIFAGFWWAMVTLTTVGYGDTAPKTVPGRILGLLWMLSALIVVSFFTASMTTALTVGTLTGKVTSADSLATISIASVDGSTSGKWLDYRRINYQHVNSLDDALKALTAKKVDAVVYDEPLLRWKISHPYGSALKLLPFTLERQDYAFALPRGSALREPINTSLLELINSPDWDSFVARYLDQGE